MFYYFKGQPVGWKYQRMNNLDLGPELPKYFIKYT